MDRENEAHSRRIEKAIEKLASLEQEFDSIDNEILRFSTIKNAPLLARRDVITSTIPMFWPHVIEASSDSCDLKEHITPEDFDLLTSLKSLTVNRFNAEKGDPRDMDLIFTFTENAYTPAQTIKKRFVYSAENAAQGEVGMISEPVHIQWKEGKDLTGGINKAAMEAFEERRKAGEKSKGKGKGKKAEHGPAVKKLIDLIDKDTHQSFFNFFSYSGPHKEFGEIADNQEEDSEAEDENGVYSGMLDPFPWGDAVSVAISEDMYPNAVKYFTSAIEDEEHGETDDEESIDLDSEAEKELLKAAAVKKNKKKSKRDTEDDDGENNDGGEPAKKKTKKSSE